MEIIENIWTEGAVSFMGVEHTSQKHVLHPAIAEIVNSAPGTRALDYGCGDGRLLHLLRSDLRIDVYDKSPIMLTLAEERAGEWIDKMFHSTQEIPSSEYDTVILSMVLICVDNEDEFSQVLANCRGALKAGGVLVVAVSHPCFRPHTFSNFKTSYGQNQPFFYLKEATPFTITIADDGGHAATFVDHHWSFGYTINALVQAGFRIVEATETPDDMSHPKRNRYVSPFLILTCTRHEN